MKIITFLNHKGGVGKTTFAFTAAAGLAALGFRVVIVDADGQGSATLACGLAKTHGFYDFAVRSARFSDVLQVVDIARYWPGGNHLPVDIARRPAEGGFLWCIPGNVETMNIDPMMSIRTMRDRLRDLREDVDVVIIDTSPTPSKLHGGIYMATDYIIHPTEAELLANDGLLESIVYREESNSQRLDWGIREIEVLGIIVNKFRANTIVHTENYAKIGQKFGNLVWPPVTLSTMWPEAQNVREPVFKYAPRSMAAQDAWMIVSKIAEVLNGTARQAE